MNIESIEARVPCDYVETSSASIFAEEELDSTSSVVPTESEGNTINQLKALENLAIGQRAHQQVKQNCVDDFHSFENGVLRKVFCTISDKINNRTGFTIEIIQEKIVKYLATIQTNDLSKEPIYIDIIEVFYSDGSICVRGSLKQDLIRECDVIFLLDPSSSVKVEVMFRIFDNAHIEVFFLQVMSEAVKDYLKDDLSNYTVSIKRNKFMDIYRKFHTKMSLILGKTSMVPDWLFDAIFFGFNGFFLNLMGRLILHYCFNSIHTSICVGLLYFACHFTLLQKFFSWIVDERSKVPNFVFKNLQDQVWEFCSSSELLVSNTLSEWAENETKSITFYPFEEQPF